MPRALPALILLPLAAAAVQPNMNVGAPYRIANPLPTTGEFSTNYFDNHKDPAQPLAYFDVYSPVIESEYGEVFWTMMAPVPLPAEFVAQYAGKPPAFTPSGLGCSH